MKCWSHISTGVLKRKISRNLGSAFALAITERGQGLGWEGGRRIPAQYPAWVCLPCNTSIP